MLTAQSIQKLYATRNGWVDVLRDCSLSLPAGGSAAIMGPSGSGKSTLLNILGTLEPPTAGRLMLDGMDPFRLSEPELARFRNRRIGFVFQDHHLLPQCTAMENVLIPTLPYPAPAGDALARVRELLERVELAHRADHLPSELSGGERQRVAIARALVNRPAVVLADEPTGNLDRALADSVADLLASLVAGEGVALLVVTHSERVAQRFRDQYEMLDGVLTPRGARTGGERGA
jgi:lipoprotein-releasing system ATP-binding protein